MVLGLNPDVGAIDRSYFERWDNPACEIGVYMEDTFTVSVDVTNPSISCSMSDAFDVRCTISIPYITINELIDSAEVHRSASQPFWTATFHFNKTTTGGRTSSIFFNSTPVVFFMPDYTGKTNPVFVGMIPSETRKHSSWAGDETFKAHSFAWYLSHQYLPVIPNSRLNINCLTSMIYDPRSAFDPSNNNVMYPDVYVHGLLGRNLNCYGPLPYPLKEGEWYVDDASEYWRRITNLYPQNIAAVIDHGDYVAPPWVQQDFSTTTTKQQAIDRLNQYYRYVFYDKWSADASGNYQPNAYWIPFVDIDTGAGSGLALPTKVNLTLNSTTSSDLFPWLVGEIDVDQKGDERCNFVQVRCQTAGGWVEDVEISGNVFHPVYNTGASAPYELPIEYYNENSNIATLADCSANATDIMTYYGQQVLTYRMTFKMRSDLELYQLVAVSGFNNSTYGEMEDGDYRIIDITYRLANGRVTNEVEVILMKADKYAAYQNVSRVYASAIQTIQNIVKTLLAPTNQTSRAYALQDYASGPCPMWVRTELVAGAVETQKLVYYAGTAAVTAGDPILITVGSDGALIGTLET